MAATHCSSATPLSSSCSICTCSTRIVEGRRAHAGVTRHGLEGSADASVGEVLLGLVEDLGAVALEVGPGPSGARWLTGHDDPPPPR
jgi:hypothetical protein